MKEFNINNYNTFVFDCDGVILDSNNFKNKIFLKAVKKFPKNKILIFENYIKKNKGYSRYNFFNYFFHSIIKLKNKEYNANYNLALNFYEQELKKNYENCKSIPGFLKFIKKIKNNNKYIISGSNEKELIRTLKNKNIFSYFKKIYGSPTSKINNALKLNNLLKPDVKIIYFGDSYYDYLVSKKIKSDFVFISGYSDDIKLHKLKRIYKYYDFTTL